MYVLGMFEHQDPLARMSLGASWDKFTAQTTRGDVGPQAAWPAGRFVAGNGARAAAAMGSTVSEDASRGFQHELHALLTQQVQE